MNLKHLKETALMRAFAFAKIPLLFLAKPTVIEVSDDSCLISLPFNRMNKNHLGSLYFGALSIGADTAGGLIAMRLFARLKGKKGSLIFKNFQADFLKRAEGETFFRCDDGPAIQAAVKKASETGERIDTPVHITATVPSKFGDEPVAKFILGLSLKVK